MNQRRKSGVFVLIARSFRLITPLAQTSIFFAIVILLSYYFEADFIYRPLGENSSATHPITAIMAILIATSLLSSHFKKPVWTFSIMLLPIIIIGLRMNDIFNGTMLVCELHPFSEQISEQLRSGQSNSVGINTVTTYILIILSVIGGLFHRPILNQAAGFFAITLLATSIIGYLYGAYDFYGQMSVSTIILLMPLALASILMTANRGILRAFLINRPSGKIARYQIALGYTLIFLTGLFSIFLNDYVFSSSNLNSLITVIFGTFFTLIIIISTLYMSQIERRQHQYERKLSLHAQYDHLTGLYNRHYFLTLWENLELENQQKNLCFLILDLDYFKQINDHYGHIEGDKVLKKFAVLLKGISRQDDILARFGGEEFILVTQVFDTESAGIIAERIRLKLQQESFTCLSEEKAITCSIGIYCSKEKEALKEMIRKADLALYKAKNDGRNCVKYYDPELETSVPQNASRSDQMNALLEQETHNGSQTS